MRIIFYLLIGGIAAGVSFGFSLIIWKLSMRFRLYPKLRERDVHTRPTPRLGGIGMFLGVVVAFGVASLLPNFAIVFAEPAKILGVLGGALLIVLVGVADDIWDLDWMTKLAAQLISAGILAWQGVQLIAVPLPGFIWLPSPILSLMITVVLLVLVMNAVNFIDGLDGLVAGVAILANSAFFIYAYVVSYAPTAQSDYFNLAQLISAALIGACVGFLPLNWHPARLFMGDAGALLTGLLMAASTVAITTQLDTGRVATAQLFPAFIPILLPFAVLIVPLLDFGLAVFRRLRAGKSPFSADRKHLHHRLLDMGHTHFHAVLIFYAWTATASIGVLLLLFAEWWWAVGFTTIAFVICAGVTLAPLSRRKAVEAAVQSSSAPLTTQADAARFDPLDAASDPAADPTEEQAAKTLDLLATGPVTTPTQIDSAARTSEEDPR